MTPNQKRQWNKMRAALHAISKSYQTPDQLRRNADRDWGLPYEEALEMAYENIQDTARDAMRGVRKFEEGDE